MLELQSKYIPLSKSGKNDKPWISLALKSKIGVKRNIYKRSKQNENLLPTYKRIQKEVNKEVFKAKCIYEDKIAERVKENPGAFYKYHRSKNKEKITVLKENGHNVDDNLTKCEIFNQYFASVFNPSSNLDHTLTNVPIETSTENIIITLNDVLNAISKLKANKSPGPDGILPRVLKEVKDQISPIFVYLFNSLLSQTFVPEDWKIANVVPIFKKGKRDVKNNYRPVSLTSILSKLMESVLAEKLREFLDSNNILNNDQHGFRRGR